MKRRLKIALFSLAGLAVGAAFAKLDFPGFRHAVIPIGKGAAKPLSINGEGGRPLLALSMRNLQKSREIEIMDSTDGSLIHSIDVLRGKGNERHNH